MQLNYILVILFFIVGSVCSLCNRQAISSIDRSKLNLLDEAQRKRMRYWPSRDVVSSAAAGYITARNFALALTLLIFLTFVMSS